jgi:hypothetical protein
VRLLLSVFFPNETNRSQSSALRPVQRLGCSIPCWMMRNSDPSTIDHVRFLSRAKTPFCWLLRESQLHELLASWSHTVMLRSRPLLTVSQQSTPSSLAAVDTSHRSALTRLLALY